MNRPDLNRRATPLLPGRYGCSTAHIKKQNNAWRLAVASDEWHRRIEWIHFAGSGYLLQPMRSHAVLRPNAWGCQNVPPSGCHLPDVMASVIHQDAALNACRLHFRLVTRNSQHESLYEAALRLRADNIDCESGYLRGDEDKTGFACCHH